MTMLEKYLMKLFTFTLYFIIIYVNETAGENMFHSLIKRGLFQKRVEWDSSTVYSECHDRHDQSKPCNKKDWTADENYRYNSVNIKSQPNMDLDDCFNACWEDDNCFAVSREKGGNRACIFLAKNYGKEYDKKYDSYIPRCCTLNEPPVEPTEEPKIEPPKKTEEPPIPDCSKKGIGEMIGSKYNIREVKVTDDTQRPSACELPVGNSRSCDKTTWFHYNDIELNYNQIAERSGQLSLEACLNLCLENSGSCVAIAINKSDKTCYMFGAQYGSKYNHDFDTYIARCCFPSDPISDGSSGSSGSGGSGGSSGSGGSGGSDGSSGSDLPVIVDLYVCKSKQEEYLPSTPGDTFYDLRQNIDYAMSPYNTLTQSTTETCQSKCATDTKCRAFSMDWNENVCHFYDHFKLRSYERSVKKDKDPILYIKFRCELNKNSLMFKKQNLLIVSDYRPYCQQISEPSKACTSLIWLFKDETRNFGAYMSQKVGTITGILDCLNKCLKLNCYAASIDYVQRTCYAFYEMYNVEKKTVPQSSWSTYKLQCCDQPKLE